MVLQSLIGYFFVRLGAVAKTVPRLLTTLAFIAGLLLIANPASAQYGAEGQIVRVGVYDIAPDLPPPWPAKKIVIGKGENYDVTVAVKAIIPESALVAVSQWQGSQFAISLPGYFSFENFSFNPWLGPGESREVATVQMRADFISPWGTSGSAGGGGTYTPNGVWFPVATTSVQFEVRKKGDANGDGNVDAADLNILGVNWQQVGLFEYEGGDFNLDGIVDAADLNILGQGWGS